MALKETSQELFFTACSYIIAASNYSRRYDDLEGGFTLYIKQNGIEIAVAEFIDEEFIHNYTTPPIYRIHPTILKEIQPTIFI